MLNGNWLVFKNHRFIGVITSEFICLWLIQTNDITQVWDGTYNGTVCQSGSYVFKVTYNTSLHSLTESETKIGTVMLAR